MFIVVRHDHTRDTTTVLDAVIVRLDPLVRIRRHCGVITSLRYHVECFFVCTLFRHGLSQRESVGEFVTSAVNMRRQDSAKNRYYT